MDTTTSCKPTATLSDYLAEERTFLAWIRTGIALMGFGFLLAHFGFALMGFGFLLAHLDFSAAQSDISSAIQTGALARVLGVALVAVGVIVNLLALRRYLWLVGALKRGQFIDRAVSKEGVTVAMLLALLGIAATAYMIVATPPAIVPHHYPPVSIGDDHGDVRDALHRI